MYAGNHDKKTCRRYHVFIGEHPLLTPYPFLSRHFLISCEAFTGMRGSTYDLDEVGKCAVVGKKEGA
jgi:hypothetical protein